MYISKNRRSMVLVKHQSGAALIVALVILAAITLIGLSNMQSASLQMNMITSTMDRNKAFAIAEGGLSVAEAWLENGSNIEEDDLFTDTCAGECFTATCADGLCFDGSFVNTMDRIECEVSPNANVTERVAFWRDDGLDVWNQASRHRTINFGTESIKYIVEFLCFVDDGSGNFGPLNPDDGDPLFRITVFVEGAGGRAPVMLQSTYAFSI